MRPSRFVANFDSSTAFLRATARYLHGEDFPSLGAPRWLTPKVFGDVVSKLPDRTRRFLYSVAGAFEAVTPRQLRRFDAEGAARWSTRLYPERFYPAVAIGSSSGALVHLCAALGIPWLPQTYLIPVKSDVSPDDPRGAFELGKRLAPLLLDRNPELRLHHMHDPAQDRLMLERMTYFRVKRTRLGEAYKSFLRSVLPPGGTIFVTECRRAWPVTRVNDRHVFQMGALGGPGPDEFFGGSTRISDYLEQEEAEVEAWDPPEPTELAPEAEWGFDESLRDDLETFARTHDYRIARVLFDEPEDLSPLVADLYAWWYRERGIATRRLVIESFVEVEPWEVLRKGAVPYWMKFNMEDDAYRLEEFLEASGPWDHIHLMLFQHGVNGPGLTPVERWRELLADYARVNGTFVGVDPEKHPRDFASFVRYHTDLASLPARYPMPAPMTLESFERFLAEHGGAYPVKFVECSHGAPCADEAEAEAPRA